MTILKTGDHVLIGYADRWSVPGIVKLASPNGKSLMLQFEALLGGYAGLMPVLQRDDGSYRDLLMGKPVHIEDPRAEKMP